MKKKLLIGLATAALMAVGLNSPEVSAQSSNSYNDYGYSYNTNRRNYWNYGYRIPSLIDFLDWSGLWNWGYGYDYGYNNYNRNITYYNGRYWYTDRNNVSYYWDNGQWVRYVEPNNNRIVYYNGRYWYTDDNNVSYYWSNGQWVRYVEPSNDYFYYNGRYYKLDANNKYLVWENGQWVPLEDSSSSSSEDSSSSSDETSSEVSSETSSESSSEVSSESSSEVSSEVSSESSSDVSSEVSSESSSEVSSEVSSESSSEVSSEVSSESSSEVSSEVSSESSSEVSSEVSSESSSEVSSEVSSESSSEVSSESSTESSYSTDTDFSYNPNESVPEEGYTHLPEAVRPPGTPYDPAVYNDPRYRYSDGYHYFVEPADENGNDYYWIWMDGRWFIKTNTNPDDPGLDPDVHSSITEEGYNYDETVSPKLFSEVNVGYGRVNTPLPFKNVEEFKNYVIENYHPVFKDNLGNDLTVKWTISEDQTDSLIESNAASPWAGRYIIQANITGYKDWEWGWVKFVYEVKGFDDADDDTIEYGYEDLSKAQAAFAAINAERQKNGLEPLVWDDASYTAGQEILQHLLKNWDSSGPVERRIEDPATVGNKWAQFAYADLLMNPELKSASVSYLLKGDGVPYWRLNINQ